MTSTVPLLTPALAEYIRGRFALTPDEAGTVPVGVSPQNSRNANRASELELVKQYTFFGAPTLTHGSFLLLLPAARTELKRYDQRQLPSGVKVTANNLIENEGKPIGHLRRSGAGRGGAVRWDGVHHDGAVETNVASGVDRIAVIRAVCKAAGIELPGEET